MFKTEATLGLIASILTCVALVLLLLIGLVFGILVSAATSAVSDSDMAELDAFMEENADDETLADYQAARVEVNSGIGKMIGGLVLLVASVVLGFIGSAKLRADKKLGGILLIIAGVLCLIPMFLAQWWGVVSMVLFLVAGIMAVAKKPQAPTEA